MLGQHRSTQHKEPRGADDEAALTADIIALARQYGRYGYRRVTALLRDAGWQVNRKRVERIWRKEGLKVPQKQPKRGRLWLNDGSCIRLRPEYPGHVWSYDFVEGRTHDGRKFRILSIIDEASRECLALPVARRLRSQDVLAALADLFVTRGPPAHIRSDNGPEFIAKAVQHWLGRIGVKTLTITPGSPWENGYCASFNGSLRDELLDGEIFYTLAEAQVLIEAWRRHDNTIRPHEPPGLSPAGPGSGYPASAALRLRFAPPAGGTGGKRTHALTINTDHSVEAGQRRLRCRDINGLIAFARSPRPVWCGSCTTGPKWGPNSMHRARSGAAKSMGPSRLP